MGGAGVVFSPPGPPCHTLGLLQRISVPLSGAARSSSRQLTPPRPPSTAPLLFFLPPPVGYSPFCSLFRSRLRPPLKASPPCCAGGSPPLLLGSPHPSWAGRGMSTAALLPGCLGAAPEGCGMPVADRPHTFLGGLLPCARGGVVPLCQWPATPPAGASRLLACSSPCPAYPWCHSRVPQPRLCR